MNNLIAIFGILITIFCASMATTNTSGLELTMRSIIVATTVAVAATIIWKNH